MRGKLFFSRMMSESALSSYLQKQIIWYHNSLIATMHYWDILFSKPYPIKIL